MSDSEDIKRIEELIEIVKRRKHVLDKAVATDGVHTQPGIVLHQQDAETEIRKLENQKQELLAAIVMPEITRRRDAWAQSVADRIVLLSDKGLTAEDLLQNEGFTTAFLHASQVALRTHQKEKLRALRNVVLNSAMHGSTDEDLQLIFLRYIDIFSPLHLRILHLLNDIQTFAHTNNIPILHLEMDVTGTYCDLIEYVFPKLKGRKGIYQQVAEDLWLNGLLKLNDINWPIPERYIYESRTTEMGKEFLSFITSPIDDDGE